MRCIKHIPWYTTSTYQEYFQPSSISVQASFSLQTLNFHVWSIAIIILATQSGTVTWSMQQSTNVYSKQIVISLHLTLLIPILICFLADRRSLIPRLAKRISEWRRRQWLEEILKIQISWLVIEKNIWSLNLIWMICVCVYIYIYIYIYRILTKSFLFDT